LGLLKAIKPPIFKNGYTDELDSVGSKGHVSVPQGRGWGVEVDWEWVKKHETGKVVYDWRRRPQPGPHN